MHIMDNKLVFSDEVTTLDELVGVDGPKVTSDELNKNEVNEVERYTEAIDEKISEVDEEDVDIKDDIVSDNVEISNNDSKKEEYIIPKDLDSIEFPDDDEDEDDSEDAKEDQEKRDSEVINDKLKKSVKSKIKTVAGNYNLTAFTISKKPVALNAVLDTVECPTRKAADWVAYSTGHKFRMLGFTGAEIDKLGNPGGNRMTSEAVRYKMIFDHIIDADKPATMEQWAKVTSYYDIEHYWFGGFRATFEGEAYMPITNCPTDNKHVFLTDNLDIMDFVKFEDDNAKQRFADIYNGKIAKPKSLYRSEVVPVSEDFAIAFREPSIYNMVFEIAMLDPEFVTKYNDIITLICYIDDIYYINKQTMTLDPIEYRHWPNNTAKTIKSKIIQYGKAIRKLSSDQYHAILMYIQEIAKRGSSISYQIPEVTCIECQTTIPATPMEGNELVFMRHKLAALAAL